MRKICFTSDLDWATEKEITVMLEFFKELEVPLTVFVTHNSEVIQNAYRHIPQHVGLHPNFMPQSSHGNTYQEVIDFCQRLWNSKYYRSHCYFDNTRVTMEFSRRRFKYNSNIPLFLLPDIKPFKHFSGILYFPVFWEDDLQFPLEFNRLQKRLDTDGLKIFAIHPSRLSQKELKFLRDVINHVGNRNLYYLDDLYNMEVNKE